VQAGTIADGLQTITIGDDSSGIAVIDWGIGVINGDQPAGFNVGADATLHFAGANATGNAVLNIDSSGQSSQILGAVDTQGTDVSVFIANHNGIIVGATGSIAASGRIGLIANTMSPAQQAGFDGSPSYAGTGGDVTLVQGSRLAGASLLVTGGDIVTVDLASVSGSGLADLSTGLPSSGAAGANASAQLNLVAGTAATFTGGTIASAGNATSSGDIDLATSFATIQVAGTFTNEGTLRLGFNTFTGVLDNEGVVVASGNARSLTVGGLVNNGCFGSSAAPFSSITTTGGEIVNHGPMYAGLVATQGGGLVNTDHMETDGLLVRGGLTNSGYLSVSNEGIYNIQIVGGDVVNSGAFVGGGPGTWLQVSNGSVTNTGRIEAMDEIETLSDSSAASFRPGADYSIRNSGTIADVGAFVANVDHEGSAADNTSTGSFSNTGTIALEADGGLGIDAWNDASLAGTLQVAGTPVGGSDRLNTASVVARHGILTLAVPLYAAQRITLSGGQVKVMNDADTLGYGVYIDAGHLGGSDYDIRIAAGKTVSGPEVRIEGSDADTHPNLMLQGTIAGGTVSMGYRSLSGSTLLPLGDVFAGPAGRILATGDHPWVSFNFTGRVKNAPYLNSSFRYNYMPITVTSAGSVALTLNPVAYQTNGTDNGKATVNILVNGSVVLNDPVQTTVHAGDTAAPGNGPNTHLVLQATGNIQTDASVGGDFYWPGYVYLGTIATDGKGHALPGTLGTGAITTAGEFNNVLPGGVASGAGVHFMTKYPLVLGGDVVTNAGAWINFPLDALTRGYADGSIDTQGHAFYGGARSPDGTVTYGKLAPSMFHTHPVDPRR
jgi:filamentous hemagglutinin family protein